MENKTTLIPKSVIGICEIAARKDSRPIFKGVHIKGNRVEACDGFLLLAMNLEDASTDSECIVDAKSLQRVLGSNKTKMPTVVTIKEDEIEAVNVASNEKTILKQIEGIYPNTSFVIPSEESIVRVIPLNVKLLKRLVNAIDKAGIEHISLNIPDNLTKPIVIKEHAGASSDKQEVKDRDLTGLISPLA